MKRSFGLLPLLLLGTAALAQNPATDVGPRQPAGNARLALVAPDLGQIIAAVRAADDERVAAVKAGDRARLEAIFDDALHYAHSSGHIDTKASYIEALASRSTIYETYDYAERRFEPIAEGVTLMIGRVLIHARHGADRSTLDLNYLAVWREDHGKWRFLAWQSSKPTTAPPAK
jgi:hypothetical protein